MVVLDQEFRSILELATGKTIQDADWGQIRKCLRAVCEERSITDQPNSRGHLCATLSPRPDGQTASVGAMSPRSVSLLAVAKMVSELVRNGGLSVLEASRKLASIKRG